MDFEAWLTHCLSFAVSVFYSFVGPDKVDKSWITVNIHDQINRKTTANRKMRTARTNTWPPKNETKRNFQILRVF